MHYFSVEGKEFPLGFPRVRPSYHKDSKGSQLTTAAAEHHLESLSVPMQP